MTIGERFDARRTELKQSFDARQAQLKQQAIDAAVATHKDGIIHLSSLQGEVQRHELFNKFLRLHNKGQQILGENNLKKADKDREVEIDDVYYLRITGLEGYEGIVSDGLVVRGQVYPDREITEPIIYVNDNNKEKTFNTSLEFEYGGIFKEDNIVLGIPNEEDGEIQKVVLRLVKDGLGKKSNLEYYQGLLAIDNWGKAKVELAQVVDVNRVKAFFDSDRLIERLDKKTPEEISARVEEKDGFSEYQDNTEYNWPAEDLEDLLQDLDKQKDSLSELGQELITRAVDLIKGPRTKKLGPVETAG